MTNPNDPPHALKLTLLPATLALCRLSPNDPIPAWAAGARTFMSITHTTAELSIVADQDVAAIAEPLAAAGVPIFPIATYDTDYLLARDAEVGKAAASCPYHIRCCE